MNDLHDLSDPERRSRSLRPAFFTLAAITFGIGLTEPVLPLYARELGASPLGISLVVSTRWGMRLLTNLPAGILSDRHGRRKSLIAGAAAIAVSAVIAATATSWPILLFSRALEGFGAGAFMTVFLAVMSDANSDSGKSLTVAYGHYQAIHRVGFWIGPTVGAALFGLIGARSVMALFAILMMLGLALSLRIAETHSPSVAKRGSAGGDSTSAFGLFRNPNFLLGALLLFAAFVTLTGTQFTAIPVFIADSPNLGAPELSLSMFLINGVGFLLIYPSAWLADRIGRIPLITIFGFIGASGLWMLGSASSRREVLLASILVGGVTAMRGPALQAHLMEASGSVNRGKAAGAFQAFGDLGSASGPLLVAIGATAGLPFFFRSNALLVGLLACLFALRARKE